MMTVPHLVNNQLRPNDVAVILRPEIEDGSWSGNFEVTIGGFGPITLKEKDMQDLVGLAVLIASCITKMEEDVEFTRILMEHCANRHGGHVEVASEVAYDPDHDSFNDGDIMLTDDTKCVGGLQ
jgi:hypothetical protein